MADKNQIPQPELIRQCASRIIRSGALGTGRVFPTLLTYLVDCTLKGRVAHEFDIAVDVFGKDEGFRDSADAQIRVHMYKLRQRLDAYYTAKGKDEPYRLEIPKGTYEVVATPNTQAPADHGQLKARASGSWALPTALTLLLVISVAANVFLALDRSSANDGHATIESSLWAGLREGSGPIVLAVGDFFFFSGEDGRVRIRDTRINSNEDLLLSAEYRAFAEGRFETITYLPKSVVFGLQSILPVASATGRSVVIKLMSELTSDDLREFDIIYVGFVRSMGILRDYYFSKSNFVAETPFLELVHAGSGTAYTRSGPVPGTNIDYGLFASFKGPTGNDIVVMTGLSDVGVLASARSLTKAGSTREIARMADSSREPLSQGFEVLLEVDGHSRTDLDYRIVGVYGLPLRY